jgi:pSer/pThr/pTyr-binding forkhead associated (FHA) protein
VPYLVINTEGKPPLRKTLEGPTIIGRARDADISIDDQRLSRHHCRLEPGTDGWSIIDLNSTNGTLVAGERVSFQPLVDGEEILIGRSRIIFHARATPPIRPATPMRDPSESGTSFGIPSPGDTLVDSRYPVPRVDPSSISSTSSETTKTKRPPLAFQRPPARPQVPRTQARPGFFTSLWRRLFGRRGA